MFVFGVAYCELYDRVCVATVSCKMVKGIFHQHFLRYSLSVNSDCVVCFFLILQFFIQRKRLLLDDSFIFHLFVC